MVADKPSISSASHFRALRWFTEQEAAVSLSSFIPEASSRIDEEAPPTTDPLEARKKTASSYENSRENILPLYIQNDFKEVGFRVGKEVEVIHTHFYSTFIVFDEMRCHL